MAAGHGVEPVRWRAMFDQVMTWIAGRFGRAEPGATARAYLFGLLSSAERKNCWQLAGHARPAPMQRHARWEADAVPERRPHLCRRTPGHRRRCRCPPRTRASPTSRPGTASVSWRTVERGSWCPAVVLPAQPSSRRAVVPPARSVRCVQAPSRDSARSRSCRVAWGYRGRASSLRPFGFLRGRHWRVRIDASSAWVCQRPCGES